MQAVALGDRNAFAVVLERHIKRVQHFVQHATNTTDNEDLVQEIFLKAWLNAATFRSQRSSLPTWLLRIARNQCIDSHRRQTVRPVGHSVSDGEERIAELDNGARSAADTLIADEQLKELHAAIAALPERQRTALTLRQLQGTSNAEAAEILGVRVAAVESLLARARKNLKAALANSSAQADTSAGAHRHE